MSETKLIIKSVFLALGLAKKSSTFSEGKREGM